MVSNLEDMALGFAIERVGAAPGVGFVADMTGAGGGGAGLVCLCLCGGGGWVGGRVMEGEGAGAGAGGRVAATGEF